MISRIGTQPLHLLILLYCLLLRGDIKSKELQWDQLHQYVVAKIDPDTGYSILELYPAHEQKSSVFAFHRMLKNGAYRSKRIKSHLDNGSQNEGLSDFNAASTHEEVYGGSEDWLYIGFILFSIVLSVVVSLSLLIILILFSTRKSLCILEE